MDDPQIHGTIEQRVAEELSCGSARLAVRHPGLRDVWFHFPKIALHRAPALIRLRPLRRGELLRDLPNVAVGI